ncbi:copper homeostasis protein CutC [Shewanella sp. VB17]|uniref:copper homeostasis protein CutC n=1 Tax=Shewanella sp. VB17 TaxID=2739432 RepID=UPI0015652E5B|nr:copper homeostasis protein CutC [Shewanella sp. VB17]NRD75236.1 copper homeostasis protein CutC [Shewanella sp. VB17]
MSIQIEVCIDNLESLHNAIHGGADRIELCSSLALGGLTPSFGFMKQAASISSIPIYAMIRPRQGDFVYDNDDISAMIEDIHAAKLAGLQGVVFGVLTPNGDIDMPRCERLMKIANNNMLGVTFHRAVDLCTNYKQAIENIAQLGCERILTSGLARNAVDGIDVIADMVKMADNRFNILAGASITAENVNNIIKKTAVTEIHLSGKSTRPSKMKRATNNVKMGSDDVDDSVIPITDAQKIDAVRRHIK